MNDFANIPSPDYDPPEEEMPPGWVIEFWGREANKMKCPDCGAALSLSHGFDTFQIYCCGCGLATKECDSINEAFDEVARIGMSEDNY